MSIAQLSPTSVAANPAYVNPQVRTDNNSTPAQSNQAAQIAVQTMKTDTVTLSPQALLMSSRSQGAESGARKNDAEQGYGNLAGKR